MFAGPNGSGKSTFKRELPGHWLGTYLNADDVQQRLDRAIGVDLGGYGVWDAEAKFTTFAKDPGVLSRFEASDTSYEFEGATLYGRGSYLAAVTVEFIRKELLIARTTMSFETVMSHPSKVRFLAEAQAAGYRTYLYFIATENPDINVRRVQLRVAQGGHDVPEPKIRSRYERSLGLLRDAVRQTDRAYLFDSSSGGSFEDSLIAEVTDGRRVELKADVIPAWVQRHLLT